VTSDAVSEPDDESEATLTPPVTLAEAAVNGPAEAIPPAPTTAAAALIGPLIVRCAADMPPTMDSVEPVMAPADVRPLVPTTAAVALRVPATVRCIELIAPAADSAEAETGWDEVIPAAETMPEAVRKLADNGPTAAETAVTAPAEIDPLTVAEDAWTRPVTDSEFATKPPAAVAVRPELASITDSAFGPTRTTPLLPPVPASNTRSPPAEPLWPAD
jgi:hypothetical protein